MRRTGHQACTATRYEWWLGPKSDPAVTSPAQQVKVWVQIWRSLSDDDSLKERLREAWNHALQRTAQATRWWSSVLGPLQATIGSQKVGLDTLEARSLVQW